MPLGPDEFPDHRFHHYCPLCEQWHHGADGSRVLKKGGPFSAFVAGYRRSIGDDDPRARWICFACQKDPPKHPLRWLALVLILLLCGALLWVGWDVLASLSR